MNPKNEHKHTHKNKPKTQKSKNEQLFEQDIGPLKRSLSAKSRRFSRISDLALVTNCFWAKTCHKKRVNVSYNCYCVCYVFYICLKINGFIFLVYLQFYQYYVCILLYMRLFPFVLFLSFFSLFSGFYYVFITYHLFLFRVVPLSILFHILCSYLSVQFESISRDQQIFEKKRVFFGYRFYVSFRSEFNNIFAYSKGKQPTLNKNTVSHHTRYTEFEPLFMTTKLKIKHFAKISL